MKFTGIMPALITPLNADESINTTVLKQLIESLIDKNVDGFYIGGATGEGLALRTEERFILAEEALKAVNGRRPCIVQVAAMDFSDMIALAKHAEKIGADGISATAPLFFQYDEDDVFNYYKALADSVHIPVMVYYSPAANFNISADFAARLFSVDNITAIKWTSSNYYEMIRAKELTHGELNIINGPDEMLLMGLSAGADGGIGSTYNIMPEIIKSVYTNFRSGNIAEAQAQQRKADRIIAALLKNKTVPAIKVVLEAMGFAVGNAAFPQKRYSAEEKARIVSSIREAGLDF